MTSIDWFGFEKKDLDFPFYRKNPHVSKLGWIALFFVFIFGYLATGLTSVPAGIIACVILIVPVLYFLKWDYSAIFQKPTLRDVGLAIALFVGYMIYAVVLSMILEQVGLVGAENIEQSSVSLMLIPHFVFSLMGEEFLKFIPFVFFMRLIFKFSNKRKPAVIISMILVMFMFAGMHAYDIPTLLFAIFMQGFGSIFEFYGYIKTKNILIPYITHLCTDVFILFIVMMGF
ncbi:hypothetical protein [Methanobrevibacter sp.]|uniref:hypothetical protein n=1 Tax=Methanobrevibacter sp. TaxID=66852 RepID=UPI00388F7EDB